MKIIFAGTPDFAAGHLEALLDAGHQICAVYTQPDRPAGRGRKLTASPVKQLAQAHHLLVHQPKSLKSSEELALLRSFEADLMVVVAYGLILPQSVLDTPLHGCINVHASLLPRWRGAAPIQRAIEAGDKETGVTIMQMDAGLDTGDMLYKTIVEIEPSENAASLHDKLLASGRSALCEALEFLTKGTLFGEKQDDNLATYAHKLMKSEALVNWADSAEQIERKIRAFDPWPGTQVSLNGQTLKFKGQLASQDDEGSPGSILKVSTAGLLVATGKGSMLITELQLPGKKMMSVKDILNGQPERFKVGMGFDLPEDSDS